MGSMYVISILLLITSAFVFTKEKSRPNIVIFVADDMGWDDVSFHGSDQVLTPNIDLLAYTGVTLKRYYTHPACTPSRAALLTGKFAYSIGMHGYPLTNGEDRGLPLSEKILPQYLKELGYSTHLVGKWHLGRSRTAYLPTSRGFDSYFGHKGGCIDYYEYTAEETWSTGPVSGFDLTRNTTAAWEVEGYITDVYTEEAKSLIKSHDIQKPLFLMVAHNAPHSANAGALLQAPPEEVRALRHVESPERRIYAAMVKKLDDSVGDVMTALQEKQILDNTIVLFIGDNGGMTSGLSLNYASNFPLRGLKFSPFEGGVRVAGILWSSTLNIENHLWEGYVHVVDWLPTLLRAVGVEPPTDIDGLDLWDNMIANKSSKREEFFEIDDYIYYNTIVSGDYKLITGNVEESYSTHQGGNLRGIIGETPSYVDFVKNSKMYSLLNKIGKQFEIRDIDLRNKIRVNCENFNVEGLCYPNSDGKVCLFNIKDDPCETKDLSDAYPDIVKTLLSRLQSQMSRTLAKPSLYRDPRALPSLFNNTWSPWADNL